MPTLTPIVELSKIVWLSVQKKLILGCNKDGINDSGPGHNALIISPRHTYIIIQIYGVRTKSEKKVAVLFLIS